MNNESTSNLKLGVFVVLGILIFVVAVYIIGINKNLFGSNFMLRSEFKNVNGLKQGSNVRLSGVNVGSVYRIEFISDSLVLVKFLIKKEVQQFIKTDAVASIGSDGLVGDKVLIITPGSSSTRVVKENDIIASYKSVDVDDILSKAQKSADNIKIITDKLVVFSAKMNNNSGFLSKVMTDREFADKIDNIIYNFDVSANEIARFTPNLNNKNSMTSKLFTDIEWANSVESSINNLQKSIASFGEFTGKLNDKNNNLQKILYDDSLKNSIISSLKNIEKSSSQLATFTSKINDEQNVLSKLTTNARLGNSIDSTIINLEKGVREIQEIEKAIESNFLFRGYFKKKKKAAEKQKMQADEAKQGN